MEQKHHEELDCPLQSARVHLHIRDALDTVQGKWRIPIIAELLDGPKRFRKIALALSGITDRMLSIELKNLEINELVIKKMKSKYRMEMEYELTAHGYELKPLITALIEWGKLHRDKISR